MNQDYGAIAGKYVALIRFSVSLAGITFTENDAMGLIEIFAEAEDYKKYLNGDLRILHRKERLPDIEFQNLTDIQQMEAKAAYYGDYASILRCLEIATLRAYKGFTLSEWADFLTVSLSTVAAWETHTRDCPIKVIEKAKALLSEPSSEKVKERVERKVLTAEEGKARREEVERKLLEAGLTDEEEILILWGKIGKGAPPPEIIRTIRKKRNLSWSKLKALYEKE